MTLLDDRPVEAPAPTSPVARAPEPTASTGAPGPARPAAPPESGAESVVRALIVLLCVAVVALTVWKLFDHVLAPSWYRTHQRHLASDYVVPRPGLKQGQAAAVLQIPGIGANLMVVEGSDANLLRGGPGHRPGTPLPGTKGNSVIEGHLDRWGGPFHNLPKLVKRTRIVAMDRSGIPVEYRVTTIKQVKRADVGPYLRDSRDTRITLVTHAGNAFTDDRFVVQAVAGEPNNTPPKEAIPALDPAPAPALPALLGVVLCVAAAAAAWFGLRRDHGRIALAIVLVPLTLGAVLALLLAFDGALSPLL